MGILLVRSMVCFLVVVCWFVLFVVIVLFLKSCVVVVWVVGLSGLRCDGSGRVGGSGVVVGLV